MVELKSPDELRQMRQAGRVVGGLLQHLAALIAPGLTTKALDLAARSYIEAQGAQPAFLGYRGFPATICVSVNEEVVHGIPSERRLQTGDLVSMDVGALVNGWFADAAITIAVGKVHACARRLLETTQRALAAGIAQAKPGARVSDISHAVQAVAEQEGFGVVRDFVGHGIGKALHEDPAVPNFGAPHLGPRLQAGMVLAIEPMITEGGYQVEILRDGWTAVTKDRKLAAHFEHTVAITEAGPEVLTALPER